MGRPTDYTDEIADHICAEIASRPNGLERICEDDPNLPSARTVHRWLVANEEFRQKYAQAKDIQADLKFDQAWEIASGASTEDVQVARLQIDTIKWQTARLAPRKYGDRVEQVHSGQVDMRTWLATAE